MVTITCTCEAHIVKGKPKCNRTMSMNRYRHVHHKLAMWAARGPDFATRADHMECPRHPRD
eukprot:4311799-Alexandrium_andersonii.AAC.2